MNHHRFGKKHGIPEHTDCLTHQAAFATWFHGVVRVFGILGVQSDIRLGITSLALTKARRLWKLPMDLIHIQTSVDHISFIWYIYILWNIMEFTRLWPWSLSCKIDDTRHASVARLRSKKVSLSSSAKRKIQLHNLTLFSTALLQDFFPHLVYVHLSGSITQDLFWRWTRTSNVGNVHRNGRPQPTSGHETMHTLNLSPKTWPNVSVRYR